MPRHPPCALKNLTITHNQHTNPTKRGRYANDCVHTQNLRCSRPLCSSQTTTPTHTTQPPHQGSQTVMRRKPETPKTPHPTPPQRQDHKGVGSCCLRTQQCAKRTPNQHHQHFPRTHPTNEGQEPYSRQQHQPGTKSVDIPPMSTHRRTNAYAMGILLTTPTPHTTQDANSCRRSLERR